MIQEGSVLTEVGQPIVADSFSSMNESDMEELSSILQSLNTSIGDNSTSKQDSVATAGSEEMAVSDSLGVPKSKGNLWRNHRDRLTACHGNDVRITGPFVRGIHRSPMDSPHTRTGPVILALIKPLTCGDRVNSV